MNKRIEGIINTTNNYKLEIIVRGRSIEMHGDGSIYSDKELVTTDADLVSAFVIDYQQMGVFKLRRYPYLFKLHLNRALNYLKAPIDSNRRPYHGIEHNMGVIINNVKFYDEDGLVFESDHDTSFENSKNRFPNYPSRRSRLRYRIKEVEVIDDAESRLFDDDVRYYIKVAPKMT